MSSLSLRQLPKSSRTWWFNKTECGSNTAYNKRADILTADRSGVSSNILMILYIWNVLSKGYYL